MFKKAFAFFVLAAMFSSAQIVFAQKNDLPKEFEQLLPRGRIAAITHPQFVPAEKASVSKNSYVLGVVIDGQARAYSLNLLNAHEVVNDQIGKTAFAAVW